MPCLFATLGKIAYAIVEADIAYDLFSQVEERKRKKHALNLKALALSASGKDDEAEAVMNDIRDLCLGPLEDGDKEIQRLKKTITLRRRQLAQAEMRADSGSRSGSGSGNNDDGYNNGKDKDNDHISHRDLVLQQQRQAAAAYQPPDNHITIPRLINSWKEIFYLTLGRRIPAKLRKGRRILTGEWDYNLITAYAILATVVSFLVCIVIPLVYEAFIEYRGATQTAKPMVVDILDTD
jgi:hypothetical protein